MFEEGDHTIVEDKILLTEFGHDNFTKIRGIGIAVAAIGFPESFIGPDSKSIAATCRQVFTVCFLLVKVLLY